MEAAASEQLRYPIGRYKRPEAHSPQAVGMAVASIEGLPRKLLAQVLGVAREQLDRRYRPESWTVRQLVNHIVDANVNNYTRFKFALTEENPTIKPYLEDRWSDLRDARDGDVRPALDLASAIHAKWVQCMRGMSEADWKRAYFHPDQNRLVPLWEAVALYAWHGEHHLAHIRLALG